MRVRVRRVRTEEVSAHLVFTITLRMLPSGWRYYASNSVFSSLFSFCNRISSSLILLLGCVTTTAAVITLRHYSFCCKSWMIKSFAFSSPLLDDVTTRSCS